MRTGSTPADINRFQRQSENNNYPFWNNLIGIRILIPEIIFKNCVTPKVPLFFCVNMYNCFTINFYIFLLFINCFSGVYYTEDMINNRL